MADVPANPVIIAAKTVKKDDYSNEIVLNDGRKAIARPVSVSLIEAVTAQIKDPDIPMVYIEEKEREVANPDDPTYQRALEEANRKRGSASMDALIMFGVELVDGMPEDDMWLQRLRNFAKHSGLDLSEFDLDDPLDKEFVYKRYFAVPTKALEQISRASGLTNEEVAKQESSFQGN